MRQTPASASQSDRNGHAGVGPAATGPAAPPLPPRACPLRVGRKRRCIRRRRACLPGRRLCWCRRRSFSTRRWRGGNAAQTPAGATGPGATGSDAMSPAARSRVVQATKPNDAPSPQSPASLTKAPGDAAQPSPIAVAAAPIPMPAATIWRKTGKVFQPRPPVMRSVRGRAALMDHWRPGRATQLARMSEGSESRATGIEIELEPASLGASIARLDFGRDGRISAMFVAETREALDALRPTRARWNARFPKPA